jgi:hypothetical protein
MGGVNRSAKGLARFRQVVVFERLWGMTAVLTYSRKRARVIVAVENRKHEGLHITATGSGDQQ